MAAVQLDKMFAVVLLVCLVPAKLETRCPGGFSNFAHPKYCEQYFTCLGGVTILRGCPPFTAFDIKLRQCSHVSQVVCGKRTYISTSSKKHGESNLSIKQFQLTPTKTLTCSQTPVQVVCTNFAILSATTTTTTTTLYTKTVTMYKTEDV